MIDKNKKYTTTAGHDARIYATDGQGITPVHGAVLINGEWEVRLWTREGTVFSFSDDDDDDSHEFRLVEITNDSHLHWIYRRLISVHGEPPNVDYMVKLKEIADQILDDSTAKASTEEVKEKIVRWVNVYSNENEVTISNPYLTKEYALQYASKSKIACIKIEFTEGEGLD